MNKNIIKLFAAVAITSAIFTGCAKFEDPTERTSDQPSQIEAMPNETHYNIDNLKDTTRSVKSKDGEIYKEITIKNLQITQKARADKEQAQKMNAVLTQALERRLNVYNSECEALYKIMADGTLDSSALPIKTEVSYDIHRNDGRAISIEEKIITTNAGVEVSSISFTYNFDSITGSQITTSVFCDMSDSADFNNADNMIFEALKAKYGEESISYDNLGYASYVDAALDKWYFTDNGIKVLFNAGEIADEALGKLEIDLTKDMLSQDAQRFFI